MKKYLIAMMLVGNAHASVMHSFFIPEKAIQLQPNTTYGTLDYFDNQGGALTLNSVELILSGSMSAIFTLVNQTANPVTGSAEGDVYLSFFGTPGNVLADFGLSNPAITLTASTGDLSVPSGTYIDPTTRTDPGKSWDHTLLAGSGLLSDFIQAGAFTISCSSTSDISASSSLTSASMQANAGCGAEVIYNYGPTVTAQLPEPATLGLLGLGLLGLAASRGRVARSRGVFQRTQA